MKNGILNIFFLHTVLLIYSMISVLSKTASSQQGMDFLFIYSGVLICLVIYALLWQLVLKKFSLTTAFANKAVVVFWGILWGKLFFGEEITWQKIFGAAVIIGGIILVVSDNEK